MANNKDMDGVPRPTDLELAEAADWDRGCACDPVRNDFIVPFLVRLIDKERPRSVLDVGAGTGHIPRNVDRHLSYRPEWTLVDKNRARLSLALQQKPDAMTVTACDTDIRDIGANRDQFDLSLLIFTLLECLDCKSIVNSVSNLTKNNGLLLIVLPDVWLDILNEKSIAEVCKEIIKGPVGISKIDKFTNTAYPFFAFRLEYIIEIVLKVGFFLEHLVRGGPSDGTYILVFRKADASSNGALA